MGKRFLSCTLVIILAALLAGCAGRTPATSYPAPTTPAGVPLASTNASLAAPTAESQAPPKETALSPGNLGPAPLKADHPILGDRRVRQGIAHCTDRLGLIAAAYPWLGDNSQLSWMDALLPADHPAYRGAELPQYAYDAQEGQALFEAAGWQLSEGESPRRNKQGEEMRLSLLSSESAVRKAWVEEFVRQMAACGLRVEALYLPAEELYAVEGALTHRQFDLAAIARVYTYLTNTSERSAYLCDGVPAAENGWEGQNFAGWCNPAADQALRKASVSLEQSTRQQALSELLLIYAQDIPGIPLFRRMDVSAARTGMQNFIAPPGEIYTWNAAEWSLPGSETIVLGERSEPASLFAIDESYVNQLLRGLVHGLDYAYIDHAYVPLALAQMPTLENGGARLEQLTVHPGAAVVDVNGLPVYLQPGLNVLDQQGNAVIYTGGELEMNRAVVEFAFRPDLTWSDGAPVKSADYQLGFQMQCDDELRQIATEWGSTASDICDRVERIEFLDDNHYRITWKPGYFQTEALLPPLGRQPAHLTTSDGRKLSNIPPREWPDLAEVSERPLGIGPYVVDRREYGQQIELKTNPFYYGGTPATERIILRFLPAEQAASALLTGQVDVIGWDSVDPEQFPALLEAAAEGKIELTFTPSTIYEMLDMMLFMPTSR